MNNDENFNLYEKALKENPLYPAEECYIQVTKLIDDSIIRLYDSIDNYIFQDIDYSKVNAARKSKVDDNTARMQSIKQLGV